MSGFEAVWESIDRKVAAGYLPGAVAGVRCGGITEFHASGVKALGSPEPMTERTQFRIASLSKLVAGVLGAMALADGWFGLDDPVAAWLPEFAEPRVLLHPAGPLAQTVPAQTPITVRHLFSFTMGTGVIFEPTPLHEAVQSAGIGAGLFPPEMSADEYLARLAGLPLADQPGNRWMYNTSSDVFSVLIARAAGTPLREVLAEKITGPLGLESTGFFGRAMDLATQYTPTPGGLQAIDLPHGGFSKPPKFETLAGGLVSTVPDYFRFLTALADGELLPEALKTQMVSDQLRSEQRAGAYPILGRAEGWGWQTGVTIAPGGNARSVGSYGWTGGSGCSAGVDPARDLVGVVMSQRAMTEPDESFDYFWAPLAGIGPDPGSASSDRA